MIDLCGLFTRLFTSRVFSYTNKDILLSYCTSDGTFIFYQYIHNCSRRQPNIHKGSLQAGRYVLTTPKPVCISFLPLGLRG